MKANVKKVLCLLFIAIFATSSFIVAHAQSVIASITISSAVSGFESSDNIVVVYDSGLNEIFVANPANGLIQVVSDSNNTIIANVTTLTPYAGTFVTMVYDSGKGEMWVPTEYSGLLAISDTTYNIVANITSLPTPTNYEIAYDSGQGEIFVVYGYAIQVISDSSNSVVANITVPGPYSMAYDKGKSEIWVSVSNESNDLFGYEAISDKTYAVVATVETTVSGQVIYDSGKGEVFGSVAGNSGTLDVISDSSNQIVTSIPNLNISIDSIMAYDSGKGQIYINTNSGVQVVSDSNNKWTETVNTGFTAAQGIAYDSAKGEIFAANAGEPGTLAVISDSTVPEFSSPALTILAATLATTTICTIAFIRKKKHPNTLK